MLYIVQKYWHFPILVFFQVVRILLKEELTSPKTQCNTRSRISGKYFQRWIIMIIFIEPNCVYAWWDLMHHFMYLCMCACVLHTSFSGLYWKGEMMVMMDEPNRNHTIKAVIFVTACSNSVAVSWRIGTKLHTKYRVKPVTSRENEILEKSKSVAMVMEKPSKSTGIGLIVMIFVKSTWLIHKNLHAKNQGNLPHGFRDRPIAMGTRFRLRLFWVLWRP